MSCTFKITAIRHSIRNRGGDRIVADYLSFLARKGYEIDYWVNEIDTNLEMDPHITVRRIPYKGKGGTILFVLTRQFLSDIVLVDLIVMAFFSWFKNKRRIIYIAQDDDTSYYRSILIKAFIQLSYWFVLKSFKVPVISESERLTGILQKYRPLSIKTVPNGINLELFHKNSQTAYRQNRQKDFVILFFGRDDYRKGLDVALKCINALKERRPQNDWELWVIGKEIVIEGVLIKNWGFIDSEVELRDILSAADIYLMAARSEGLSLLMLQAMACQCAIVTTNVSSIIQDNVHGLISPVDQYADLANNLNALMNTPALLSQLQHNAASLALKFDVNKSKVEFEDALKGQSVH